MLYACGAVFGMLFTVKISGCYSLSKYLAEGKKFIDDNGLSLGVKGSLF